MIVWAGTVDGHVAPAPPAASWAAKPANTVGVIHLTLQPEGEYVTWASAIRLPGVPDPTTRARSCVVLFEGHARGRDVG